jgi:HSP20 family protein
MKLITYNPASELATWSPFQRLSPWRDFLETAFELAGTASRQWTPALDVREDGANITVELELAGMKKGDFDISLEDGTLTISGRREPKAADRHSEGFLSERFSGPFSRSVALPCAIQADKASAAYTDGILTVTLPKAEQARPRKIDINLN